MNSSISLVTKAAHFAARKHKNQRRKDPAQTPYINHPLEVCDILARCGVTDPAVLCAALLHDTIEDTETTRQEIVDEFGEQVAKIVEDCSDDKSLGKADRKRQQIEHAKHVSDKAKLVKIADKISNNQSLITDPIWEPKVVLGYGLWSDEVFRNLKGGKDGNKDLENMLTKCLEEMGVYKIEESKRKEFLEDYYNNMKGK